MSKMKKYKVEYVFQKCDTFEECHFRIEQFRKYGYTIVVYGNRYFIATKDKLRHLNDIMEDNGVGLRAMAKKHFEETND